MLLLQSEQSHYRTSAVRTKTLSLVVLSIVRCPRSYYTVYCSFHHHHHCLFHPVSGYRPQMTALHPSLSWANFWSPPQLYPPLFISSSMHLLHVVLGLPFLRRPWGFHCKDCLVMFSGGFLSVWPSHRHFLLPNSLASIVCPVLSHTSSFQICRGPTCSSRKMLT